MLALALIFVCDGCKTHSSKSSGPVGSITVHGNTPQQIAEVVANVFVENGFIVSSRKTDKKKKKKPAGKMNDIAFGSWIGDIPLWRRVNVSITPTPEGNYWLECEAYNIRDRGTTVEEELKVYRTAAYIRLLAQAAARLEKE